MVREKDAVMNAMCKMFQEDVGEPETFLWWMLTVYHIFRQLDTEWCSRFRLGMLATAEPTIHIISAILGTHFGILDSTGSIPPAMYTSGAKIHHAVERHS